jgi:hypothetical protein
MMSLFQNKNRFCLVRIVPGGWLPNRLNCGRSMKTLSVKRCPFSPMLAAAKPTERLLKYSHEVLTSAERE